MCNHTDWQHYIKNLPVGGYQTFDPKNRRHIGMLMGLKIRLGSYGDPAAVPFEVWQTVLDVTAGHTGYTHQFDHPNFDQRIAEICHISVETEKSAARMRSMGLSTFRVKPENSRNLAHEITCKNESDLLSCNACGLCDGTKNQSITVEVHGTDYIRERFNKKFG